MSAAALRPPIFILCGRDNAEYPGIIRRSNRRLRPFPRPQAIPGFRVSGSSTVQAFCLSDVHIPRPCGSLLPVHPSLWTLHAQRSAGVTLHWPTDPAVGLLCRCKAVLPSGWLLTSDPPQLRRCQLLLCSFVYYSCLIPFFLIIEDVY